MFLTFSERGTEFLFDDWIERCLLWRVKLEWIFLWSSWFITWIPLLKPGSLNSFLNFLRTRWLAFIVRSIKSIFELILKQTIDNIPIPNLKAPMILFLFLPFINLKIILNNSRDLILIEFNLKCSLINQQFKWINATCLYFPKIIQNTINTINTFLCFFVLFCHVFS